MAFAGTARNETPASDLDRMIGQMLMVGFDGTSPNQKGVQRIARQIAEGQIGGVLLMSRNVRSPAQVKKLTAALHSAGDMAGFVPLIAVDQEGGIVQRLSRRKGFRSYPTARTMARRHDPASAQAVYRRMADELAGAGVNLNFGPVVDIELERRSPVIARRGRSYGRDPAKVTDFARAFIAAHREAGVLTAVKHFPGHGSSIDDSHKRLVDVTWTWREIELEPYRALASDGAIDMVMVGHLYHPAFSGSEKLPATLAPKAIEGRIRHDLGFRGVVVTDDLEMGAISRYHKLRETLVKAVQSGNDILLFSKAGRDAGFAERAREIIRTAVEDGEIARERIAAAYERIVALKARLGTRLLSHGAQTGVPASAIR